MKICTVIIGVNDTRSITVEFIVTHMEVYGGVASSTI